MEIAASNTSLLTISAGIHTIKIGTSKHTQKFLLGEVYTVLAISSNRNDIVSFCCSIIEFFCIFNNCISQIQQISVVETTKMSTIHMLWILVPGFLLDIGIILFSVPGLEFAYSQAPACMKTVIMAGWLLTTAIGNLIIVIIQTIDLFEKAVSINQTRNHHVSFLMHTRIVAALQFFVIFCADVGGCWSFCCDGHPIQIC